MEQTCCHAPVALKEDVVTMAMLEPGSKGVIKSFVMNCEDSQSCRFVRRLKEMGLYAGARFEVLKNSGKCELSVSCEGTTFALGRGMADKIHVEISNGAIMSGSVFTKFCQRFGFRCQA